MSQPNMRKSFTASLPSLSVRIDLDTEARIGPGKIQVLENIRACGSISAAGRAMNMSYKRAWDLVDEINRICRRAAVEASDPAPAPPPHETADPLPVLRRVSGTVPATARARRPS